MSNLTEMVLLLNKKQFGHSSEKTPKEETNGQINLFNEAEIESNSEAEEPTMKQVKVCKKKKSREEVIKDLPIEEIECVLNDVQKHCPWCNRASTYRKRTSQTGIRVHSCKSKNH